MLDPEEENISSYLSYDWVELFKNNVIYCESLGICAVLNTYQLEGNTER